MAGQECKLMALKWKHGTGMLKRWYPFVATGIQMLKKGSGTLRDVLYGVLNRQKVSLRTLL